MKYLKPFNEGRKTQFVLHNIFRIVSNLKTLGQKIKGSYIPIKLKDKSLEKEAEKELITLMDFTLFDTIKFVISKKYKDKAEKDSFTNLIKERSGIDIYSLIDNLLNTFVEENILLSSDMKIKDQQLKKLESLNLTLKNYKSIFKKIDDNIEENKELDKVLKELGETMKHLDPRRHNDPNYIPNGKDALDNLAKGQEILAKYEVPKDMDAILDKIFKYGIGSLTRREREDLDKHSKFNESLKNRKRGGTCEDCGEPIQTYYREYCPICDIQEIIKDSKGYCLMPILNFGKAYVDGFNKETVWRYLCNNYEFGNDTYLNVHLDYNDAETMLRSVLDKLNINYPDGEIQFWVSW